MEFKFHQKKKKKMFYVVVGISATIFFGTVYFVEEICYKHCRVRRDYYERYGNSILHKKDK